MKVIDQVGLQNPCHITSGDKSQLTVMVCTCAAGYFFPSMIILIRKSLLMDGLMMKSLELCMGSHRMVGLTMSSFLVGFSIFGVSSTKASIVLTSAKFQEEMEKMRRKRKKKY